MDAPPSLTPENPQPQYTQPPSGPTPAPVPPSAPHGSSAHAENRTLMAVLAYLGFLILAPLLTPARHDPFVRFHIQQGVVLIIVEIATAMLASLFFFLWFVFPLIWLATIVLIVIGIMNAMNGKMAPLPLIGQFGERINIA